MVAVLSSASGGRIDPGSNDPSSTSAPRDAMGALRAVEGHNVLVLGLLVALWFGFTIAANVNLAAALRAPATCYTPLRVTAGVLILQAATSVWHWRDGPSSQMTFTGETRFSLVAGLLHALNTWLVLGALQHSGVAIAYSVKCAEPLVSAALLRLQRCSQTLAPFASPSGLPTTAVLGLLMAPAGMIFLFLGTLRQPSARGEDTQGNYVLWGLLLASCNVLVTSCRSIHLKKAVSIGKPEEVYARTGMYGLVWASPPLLWSLGASSGLKECVAVPPAGLGVGMLAFVGYNLCSFNVLSLVDPITHGSMNVLKRLLLIGWVRVLQQGAVPLNETQWAGLALANIGLVVYHAARQFNGRAFKRARVCTALILIVFGAVATYRATGGKGYHVRMSQSELSAKLPHTQEVSSQLHREPPMIPHSVEARSAMALCRLYFQAKKAEDTGFCSKLDRLEARVTDRHGDRCVLFNMHCMNRDNVGDMASSPVQYFRGLKAATCGGVNIDWFDNGLAAFVDVIRPNDFTVVGGGGLLAFRKTWDLAIQRVCSGGLCAVWAAGYNARRKKANRTDIVTSATLSHAEMISHLDVDNGLLGIRDSVPLPHEAEWLPDASCMLPFEAFMAPGKIRYACRCGKRFNQLVSAHR